MYNTLGADVTAAFISSRTQAVFGNSRHAPSGTGFATSEYQFTTNLHASAKPVALPISK